MEVRERVLKYMRNKRAEAKENAAKPKPMSASLALAAKHIRKRQKDKCAYCGMPLHGKGHLDHIKPKSKGGSNAPANRQWLCEACNLSKSNIDPVEFVQSLGRLFPQHLRVDRAGVGSFV
jgi:5-methylcytosine-specific restriction endonuclease McrA